jgi:hypothetical protein
MQEHNRLYVEPIMFLGTKEPEVGFIQAETVVALKYIPNLEEVGGD